MQFRGWGHDATHSHCDRTRGALNSHRLSILAGSSRPYGRTGRARRWCESGDGRIARDVLGWLGNGDDRRHREVSWGNCVNSIREFGSIPGYQSGSSVQSAERHTGRAIHHATSVVADGEPNKDELRTRFIFLGGLRTRPRIHPKLRRLTRKYRCLGGIPCAVKLLKVNVRCRLTRKRSLVRLVAIRPIYIYKMRVAHKDINFGRPL